LDFFAVTLSQQLYRYRNEEVPAMDVKESIRHRYSVRKYGTSSIPQEHMEVLFKALQLAPSANNSQNWEFVFVSDHEVKQMLVSACFNQRFIAECSYFMAGVANPSLKWHMVDITIAMTQFTLQATELGYGTCWIGAFDQSRVKEILEVPGDKKVVICMTFGIPKGKSLFRRRKRIEKFVYLNRYSERWQHA
jgi:nitroreductase